MVDMEDTTLVIEKNLLDINKKMEMMDKEEVKKG